MAFFKKGARGEEVRRIQERLLAHGFDPNGIDSVLGPGTERAVKAFQTRFNLVVDGIVGPITQQALEASPPPSVLLPLSWLNVTGAAEVMPGVPRSNIENNLPLVAENLRAADLGDKPMGLMALATIYVETPAFAPLDEFPSKYNTSPGGVPFDRYDHRSDLGNLGPPDGARFKGRGFIQLTGRSNYREIGALIGLGDGLEKDPDLANDPEIAAKILCAFLKRQEGKIRAALKRGDLAQARKLVNGGRHGLEKFAACYRRGRETFG